MTTASPWKILSVTSLAVFLVLLDALVVVVAIPAIQQSFGGASRAAPWRRLALTMG